MFHFQQKLKALKAKIRTWNIEEFGNIFQDKKQLLLELALINRKGMEVGWNEDMKRKEKGSYGAVGSQEKTRGTVLETEGESKMAEGG